MTRDNDFISGGVKVSISVMFREVFEKDIRGRVRSKFMWSGGGMIGVAKIFNDMEICIGRWITI